VKRRRLLGALAVLLACGVAGLLTDAPARFLVVEDPPVAADAAVVLAGDPDYERTLTAARLVQSGQARLLIVTGGQRGPGDGAESLRAHALAAGVDPGRIRMETTSTSTRESLLALVPILDREGVKSVLLVTSPYHQRRAFWCARRAWPGRVIHNHPASPAGWAPEGWWHTARSRRLVSSEYGKLLYYGLRGWLAPRL
jgi:uncharacterized SAM-binding protein YcdF (DUF218 family)